MIDPAYLRALWVFPHQRGTPGRRRRSTKLLVDRVVDTVNDRRLDAPDWAFRLPFGVRSGLDIELSTRTSKGTDYTVWTQGPRLCFEPGDTFHAHAADLVVQIEQSSAMRWILLDDGSLAIDEGFVSFRRFTGLPGDIERGDLHTLTQTAFLSYLMSGSF